MEGKKRDRKEEVKLEENERPERWWNGKTKEPEDEREREREAGRKEGEGKTGARERTEKEEYWTFSTEWSLKKKQSHIRDAHLPR